MGDQVNKGSASDPMVLSGTHVMEGSGKVLVTAVGVNSQAGIIFTLLGAAAEEVEDMEKKKRKEKKKKGDRANNDVALTDIPQITVDVEEGIGNAHPNHTLPNSTPGKGGIDDSPERETGIECGDEEKSVLQAKLTNLAIQIGYGGMAVSLITVIILSVQFSIDEFYTKGTEWSLYYVNYYVKFVTSTVTPMMTNLT